MKLEPKRKPTKKTFKKKIVAKQEVLATKPINEVVKIKYSSKDYIYAGIILAAIIFISLSSNF